MKLISSLPFNRQAKPVRQQLLADLRDLIRTHKLTFDLPRMRLRSLDVIPLSLSLPTWMTGWVANYSAGLGHMLCGRSLDIYVPYS